MANQAFLIKTSKEKSEEIFEASNTIPLFWFTLLDLHSIENIEKDLINSYNLLKKHYYDQELDGADYDEIELSEDSPTIKLSKKTFIDNLYAGKSFIENNFPDKMNLYSDFIHYLDTIVNENDTLELNILAIAHFSKVENFIKDVKNIIANIKLNVNNLVPFEPNYNIFSFVGYDGFFANDFRNYSKDYLEYCLKEEKEREIRNKKLAKQQSKEKIKGKFKNIFMCVGGIAFIGASILIITQGNYFLGIVGIIFGGIALLFGVVNLKG